LTSIIIGIYYPYNSNKNNMTLIEMQGMLGKRAHIAVGGLLVEVTVLDGKVSYGQTRWKVSPVSGRGEVWVEKLTQVSGEAI
jgi:hypothetical protein